MQKQARKAELLLTCSEGFVAQVDFLLPRNYLTVGRKPERESSRELVVVAVFKKNALKIYSLKQHSGLNLLDCDVLLFTNACGSQSIKALTRAVYQYGP